MSQMMPRTLLRLYKRIFYLKRFMSLRQMVLYKNCHQDLVLLTLPMLSTRKLGIRQSVLKLMVGWHRSHMSWRQVMWSKSSPTKHHLVRVVIGSNSLKPIKHAIKSNNFSRIRTRNYPSIRAVNCYKTICWIMALYRISIWIRNTWNRFAIDWILEMRMLYMRLSDLARRVLWPFLTSWLKMNVVK